MSLERKIKFLQNIREYSDKYNVFLDITDKECSCEPSLVLNLYHRWSLKYTYNQSVKENERIDFFKNYLDGEDYKAVSKMEYLEFKRFAVAYYSLGELHLLKDNKEEARVYFQKTADIVEEQLRSGNKYGHTEIKDKDDISLFEIVMWSKFNLALMEEDHEQALKIYDEIVSESDIFYLEKNMAIYNICKDHKDISKAYDSVKNIMKIKPDYKNINVESVKNFISSKNYENAIEISMEEYRRTKDNIWVTFIGECCTSDVNFNSKCIDKVLEFLDILLLNMEVTDWCNLVRKLYDAISAWHEVLLKLLAYLRESFYKISYVDYDYRYFKSASEVIRDIYEDIKLRKYEDTELRKYEYDYIFFMINLAMCSDNYSDFIEGYTKLLCSKDFIKVDDDIVKFIEAYKDKAINNVEIIDEDIPEVPWFYLKDKAEKLYLNQKQVKDISVLNTYFTVNEGKVDGKILYKFKDFNNNMNKLLDIVENHIKGEEEEKNNQLQTLIDSIFLQKALESEVSTNLNEFKDKISSDLKFLKNYVDEKIKVVVPEFINDNIKSVDSYTDVNTMRETAEKDFADKIVKWCNENVHDLIFEQFNSNIEKYKNIYFQQMEFLKKIEETRTTINNVWNGFKKERNAIKVNEEEDIINNFTDRYNNYINNIEYKFKVLSDSKLLDTFTSGVKNIFTKNEDKLQSKKDKIKNYIEENKNALCENLVQSIFEKMDTLEKDLIAEAEDMYNPIIKELGNDRVSTEGIYDVAKIQFDDMKKTHDEYFEEIKFIKGELAKYNMQMDHDLIYFKGKCYKLYK